MSTSVHLERLQTLVTHFRARLFNTVKRRTRVSDASFYGAVFLSTGVPDIVSVETGSVDAGVRK